MTYKEFLAKNDRNSANGRGFYIIDQVQYRRNLCSLCTGEVISIDTLVQFISEGQFYLTNPSKISKWQGFTGNRRRVNLNNPNRYWTDF